jgi:hypothetical protein
MTCKFQMYSALVIVGLVCILGVCGYLHISYYQYPNERT